MYLLISLKTLYKHQVEFLKFFPLLWIYYMFIVETLEYMQKLYFVWQRAQSKSENSTHRMGENICKPVKYLQSIKEWYLEYIKELMQSNNNNTKNSI